MGTPVHGSLRQHRPTCRSNNQSAANLYHRQRNAEKQDMHAHNDGHDEQDKAVNRHATRQQS